MKLDNALVSIKVWITSKGKTFWIIVGVILAALIFWLVTYSNNKRVDVLANAQVEFSGYDGKGTAEIKNYDDIRRKIVEADAKKAKLGDYLTQALLEKKDSSDIQISDFSVTDTEDADKLTRAINWANNTRVDLDKEANLKNDQSVKLKITTEDKDNPVKNNTKEFKVSGLKKVEQKTTKTIFSKLNVDFSGFNGHGFVSIHGKDAPKGTFYVKNNGKLKNGDVITLKLSKSMLNNINGVIYTGKDNQEFKVSGLKDLSSIKNIDAIQKVTDDLTNDYAKSNTFSKYENTFVNMYAIPVINTEAADNYFDDTDQKLITNKVTVNDDTSERVSSSKLKIVAVYKSVERFDNSDPSDPEYLEVSVRDLTFSKNTVNIDSISTDKDGRVDRIDKSLSTTQHNLNAIGIKLK